MHERPRHRPRRVTGTLSGSLALLLLSCVLSGCAAPEAPTPQGPPTPALSQEQRDDEAFRDFFSRYVALEPADESDEVLASLLAGDALEDELSSMHATAAEGQHGEGRATMSAFEVTGRGKDDQGSRFMVAQACLDVGGTRILDADGRDVTPTRDSRLSLQMKATMSADGAWRISDSLRNEAVHACD